MAFCTSCGTRNEDGAPQCVKCGAPMASAPASPAPPQAYAPAAPAAAVPPQAPVTPVPPTPQKMPGAAMPPAPPQPTGAPAYYPGQPPVYGAPVAPAQPNLLVLMWASLDLGARIAGIGAAVAVLSFFLPIYPGENGVNIAAGYGSGLNMAWWMRLLLPLAAIGLLYFYYNRDLRTKILVATGHCIIGSLWGFALFGIVMGESSWAFGWYLMHLGMLAIVVGGFISVYNLTQRLTGVR